MARFLLDHDVDAAVARMLRGHRQECWSAAEAGLAAASDDELSVYADDRDCVLVTHDRRLFERRRRNTFGWHVLLACPEWEAAGVLEAALPELLVAVAEADRGLVRVTASGLRRFPPRWR